MAYKTMRYPFPNVYGDNERSVGKINTPMIGWQCLLHSSPNIGLNSKLLGIRWGGNRDTELSDFFPLHCWWDGERSKYVFPILF